VPWQLGFAEDPAQPSVRGVRGLDRGAEHAAVVLTWSLAVGYGALGTVGWFIEGLLMGATVRVPLATADNVFHLLLAAAAVAAIVTTRARAAGLRPARHARLRSATWEQSGVLRRGLGSADGVDDRAPNPRRNGGTIGPRSRLDTTALRHREGVCASCRGLSCPVDYKYGPWG
jgi:hypothetical protein